MPKSRPPYPPEFRRRMIELVRAGRTPEQLAKEFEPSAQTIRNWALQAERDTGHRQDGLTTDERDELRKLRRENKILREEKDILKKAGVGSMGRRNGVGVAATGGGDARGTDGSAWALRGKEAGAVATMEGWRVAE